MPKNVQQNLNNLPDIAQQPQNVHNMELGLMQWVVLMDPNAVDAHNNPMEVGVVVLGNNNNNVEN